VEAALSRYRRTRERSISFFNLLMEEAYYSRPIPLRHPVVFYDGHLPAFSFNTLVKKTLGGPGIDPELETLFARGIDPDEKSAPLSERHADWPTRDVVRAFTATADQAVEDALARFDAGDWSKEKDVTTAVHTILEHEAMHQETLLYLWHQLPYSMKRPPANVALHAGAAPAPPHEWMPVAAGHVVLGTDRDAVAFGWDNEHPALRVHVDAFEMERHKVTNARFLQFVEAGGYRDARWWEPDDWRWLRQEQIAHPLFWDLDGSRWFWRGMFERLPMPLSWPVYVSHAEAAAFARWSGARLPSEAEYQRAAFGSTNGDRRYPWGESAPSPERGVFDFSSWDPQPCGSHPAGASAWGIEDLVGNGWEWTATPFGPLPGFQPMPLYPEYSADFFDGEHFVMKGASPATARELIRPTFRNWFRKRYPYVYAGFRCATS
jgi:ergothioneine biosynthesis protein EgtB